MLVNVETTAKSLDEDNLYGWKKVCPEAIVYWMNITVVGVDHFPNCCWLVREITK